MKNQVPDITRCKELKRIKFTQDSRKFYYVKEKTNLVEYFEIMMRRVDSFIPLYPDPYYSSFSVLNSEYFAAPLPAEMLRELPDSYGPHTTLIIEKHNNEFLTGYFDHDELQFLNKGFRNISLPNALADLYVWWKESEMKEINDGNS